MVEKIRFLGKKAVSPLVATLLLVVFSILIGVVIMTVGRGYVQEDETLSEEGFYLKTEYNIDPSLERVDITKEPAIQYTTEADKLNLVMDYNMQTAAGVKIEVIGDKGSQIIELTDISASTSYPIQHTTAFDVNAVGAVREVKVVK